MLNALFPYGVIIVFFMLFAFFMGGVGVGMLQKDTKLSGVLPVAMIGIILSFLVYHFIGWIGS